MWNEATCMLMAEIWQTSWYEYVYMFDILLCLMLFKYFFIRVYA